MKNIFRILDHLKLDEHQLKIIGSFKEDEKNPLAIAKILEKHGYTNESCDLLAASLRKDPKNKSIRTAYAKDLFQKGLVRDTVEVLALDTELIFENLLASHLMFQGYVLLEEEARAIKACLIIEKNHKHSERTSKIAHLLKNNGLSKAREILTEELEAIGIDPILGHLSYGKKLDPLSKQDNHTPITKINELQSAAASVKNDENLSCYQMIPLGSIFGHVKSSLSSDQDVIAMGQSYEEQGHYEEALRVFKDLFRKHKDSVYLKNKLQDLGLRIQEKRMEDTSIDPLISQKLEDLEKLDYKIDYLQNLLQKIEGSEKMI